MIEYINKDLSTNQTYISINYQYFCLRHCKNYHKVSNLLCELQKYLIQYKINHHTKSIHFNTLPKTKARNDNTVAAILAPAKSEEANDTMLQIIAPKIKNKPVTNNPSVA